MRCIAESARTKSLHCFGMALTIAFTFYMVVFHSLSNLPLDQALYFEVYTLLHTLVPPRAWRGCFNWRTARGCLNWLWGFLNWRNLTWQGMTHQVHKRFWMQAHIIAFGMVAMGISCLVRQAGSASRPVAALVALVLVCLQV